VPGVSALALSSWRLPRLPHFSRRRLLWSLVACLVAGTALIGFANLYVFLNTEGEATANLADVPHAEAAIVPGALVAANGAMSPMLRARVDRAALLYKAGKVDRILVSGDHHSWAYDEPDTMRKALVAQGIPGRVIFEDHAGFDTWATMVRARQIFGVKSAVVVTQGFHMPRALFDAQGAGLHATGFTADTQGWGTQGTKSDIREVFSRVKAVYDTTVNSPVMGGPQIPITGDGKSSWGPAPPPGTPPAGSPGR
jgi:SanA protein